MKALEALGPAKLHADEQQLIRDAADEMLFSEGQSAQEALDRVDELAARLVQADRLLRETADQLMYDLEGCGPAAALA